MGSVPQSWDCSTKGSPESVRTWGGAAMSFVHFVARFSGPVSSLFTSFQLRTQSTSVVFREGSLSDSIVGETFPDEDLSVEETDIEVP